MKPDDSKINTSSGEPFLISPIEDLSAFDAYPEKGVVFSEGWAEGPVAAILRGGINAKAAVEFLAARRVTDATIFHIHEKMPDL
jgi:hypothetical protein